MSFVILYALIATLCTWAVTALGASTVFFIRHPNEKLLNMMLGFSAGVMIAASFWSLLQPAIERAEQTLKTPAWVVTTVGFLCGAIFLWGSDKILFFSRKRLEKDVQTQDGRRGRFRRIFMLILSITLHNIPEGLAVGVAFGILSTGYTSEELMGALSVAVGIGLQNFPEGAAVSLPLCREGCSKKKSFLIGQGSGMVEPIAGVLGAVSVVYVTNVLPFALSFAAGAMILVAVHELIPECQQNQEADPYVATMGIVFGFAVMMLLDVALG